MSPEGQPYSRQKFLRAKTFASKGLPLQSLNVGAIPLRLPFHQTSSWYGTCALLHCDFVLMNVRNISYLKK